MIEQGREGFFRRLGRALRGVNAVERGWPVPTDDVEPPHGPTPTLVVDDPPPRPPALGRHDAP